MNHALAMEAPQVEMSALSHMTGLVDRARDVAARLYRNVVTSVGSVEYHKAELQSRAQGRVREEKGLKRTFMAAGLAGVIAVASTLVKAPSAWAGETEGLDLSDAASGGADLAESDTAHPQFDTVDAVDRPHTSPSGNAGFVEGNEGDLPEKIRTFDVSESDTAGSGTNSTNDNTNVWDVLKGNQPQDEDKSAAGSLFGGGVTADNEGTSTAGNVAPETTDPATPEQDKIAFETELTDYNSNTPIHEGTVTFATHEAAESIGLDLDNRELGVATSRTLDELALTEDQARSLPVGYQIELTEQQLHDIFDGLGEDTDTDTDEEDEESETSTSDSKTAEEERKLEQEHRKLENEPGTSSDFLLEQERRKLENDPGLPAVTAEPSASPSASAAAVAGAPVSEAQANDSGGHVDGIIGTGVIAGAAALAYAATKKADLKLQFPPELDKFRPGSKKKSKATPVTPDPWIDDYFDDDPDELPRARRDVSYL